MSKPVLLFRLGDTQNVFNEWIPTAEDMSKLQDHLEKKFGDEYHVFVFHRGISMAGTNDGHRIVNVPDEESLEKFIGSEVLNGK